MLKHYDNHQIEEELNNLGFNLIAGTDEVGRGPLAGPVVAASVIMPKGCVIEGVTDSKKIPLKHMEELANKIKELSIAYEIIFIDEETIDKINILEASRKAMETGINSLKVKPDYVLTDAMKLNIDIPYRDIIHGDQLSFTIACASILAKNARDTYMKNISKLYPEYDFENNVGYPTKKHLEALKKYGVLPIHRKSYGPVKIEIENNNFYKKQI